MEEYNNVQENTTEDKREEIKQKLRQYQRLELKRMLCRKKVWRRRQNFR